MEAQSYELTTRCNTPKSIVALRRSQAHLVWFVPYAALRTFAGARRSDIVHLGDALLAVVGLAPRYLWKRPVVVTVHGLDLTFRSRLYQLYLRWCLRPNAVLPVSESTRKIAERHGLRSLAPIPVGVSEKFFDIQRDPNADPEIAARRAGRTVLLTAGRLVRRKGVLWFIKNVLPKLQNVLYVVLGDGPDGEEIRALAEDRALRDSLLLLGKVDDERRSRVFSAADLFIMPNIRVPGDVEGFGIVAIEGAASGLPVVASNLEGIPDAIIDGKNGTLVPPEDPAAFVDAITPLLTDPELRTQRGEAARAFTRETYSWPKIIERYEQAFAEELSSAANSVSAG